MLFGFAALQAVILNEALSLVGAVSEPAMLVASARSSRDGSLTVVPGLGLVLLLSSIKVWRHATTK